MALFSLSLKLRIPTLPFATPSMHQKGAPLRLRTSRLTLQASTMPLSGASFPLQTSSLSLFSSSAPPSPCLSPSHAPPVAHPPPRPRRAQPAPKQKAASLRLFVTTLLRSEEHTSELQSLMRISYAVFCLKKKIQ